MFLRNTARLVLWGLTVPVLVVVRLLFGFGVVNRFLAISQGLATIGTLRLWGASVGRGLTCKRGPFIDNAQRGYRNLSIGNRCYLGPGAFLDLAGEIRLEDEVVLSPEVMILTHGDVGQRFLHQYMPRREGPVTLGRGCWLGARCIILPGVSVGTGAVVGAGAVVTQDVQPFTVVAGVPAREIRRLEPPTS